MTGIAKNLWLIPALPMPVAEAVVNLALVIAICRHYKTRNVDQIDSMKG